MAGSNRTVTLGPGKEFDRIRSALSAWKELPDYVEVGPGDDAAVIQGGWVVSTDISVEDVHFERAWIGDREIGYRAVVAALSDLAGMAAAPRAIFASIALPGHADWDELQTGISEAAIEYAAPLLGGDLARSRGPLVVDVTVMGQTEEPVLRNGARPGDEVWVTGGLGGSAAAVRAWTSGAEPGAQARAAFARPRARVEEALWLAEHARLHALIDLSDGLAGDVGHLAAASGVRVVIQADGVPVSLGAQRELGQEQALTAALHGGEDYELCFTAAPGSVDPGRMQERFGVELTRVGRVEEGEGVWLQDTAGARYRLERGGWDHFGAST